MEIILTIVLVTSIIVTAISLISGMICIYLDNNNEPLFFLIAFCAFIILFTTALLGVIFYGDNKPC